MGLQSSETNGQDLIQTGMTHFMAVFRFNLFGHFFIYGLK